MAASDCIKCWNTPCQCGWDYRRSPIKGLELYIKILQKVVQYKKEYPDAKFSSLVMEKETEDDNKFMEHMNNFIKGLEDESKR